MGGCFGKTPMRTGEQRVVWGEGPDVSCRWSLADTLFSEIQGRYTVLPYAFQIDSQKPKSLTVTFNIQLEMREGNRVLQVQNSTPST